MNVLDAESGSWAKPIAACCAATKGLSVLTLRSRLKSARGRERGSLAGLDLFALALQTQQEKLTRSRIAMLTIINDNTRDTQ